MAITSAHTQQVSKFDLGNRDALTFNYEAKAGVESRTLVLHTGDRKKTIWHIDGLEPVLIEGRGSTEYYEKVELMAASMNEGVVAALFRLSPGRQYRVPEHVMNPDYVFSPRGEWAENDFIVRVFVCEGAGWSSYLSFYPGTFFGDLGGESVKQIKIIDKDSIDLIYRGSWRIAGRDDYIIEGPYKVRVGGDDTVKEFRYSPSQDLLMVLDADGSEKYVERSLWWAAHNDVELGAANDRNERFFESIKERELKIEAMNIKVETLRFFSIVPDGQRDRFLKYVKYLEGREKMQSGKPN